MQVEIEAAYRERFARAFDDLGVAKDDHIILAVSGGPDSLALLLLANSCAPERIIAATVDHQLRPESAREAAYVGQICKDLGVRHTMLSPSEPISGNIQASARAARYILLKEAAQAHKCAFIATAHHGDDQLETLLMRLVRGSGINGMAGIRSRNGPIIRPLLAFSKLELEAICEAAGIRPVRDPSNDNSDFDRVAMRQWLAKAGHPFDIKAITRTACSLGEATAALEWMANLLAAERIGVKDGGIALDVNDLPSEMQRRLLLIALQKIDPDIAPRGDSIERLLVSLKTRGQSMIANIRCQGGEVWYFSPAPPRRTSR